MGLTLLHNCVCDRNGCSNNKYSVMQLTRRIISLLAQENTQTSLPCASPVYEDITYTYLEHSGQPVQPELLHKESKFPGFYISLDIDISHNKMINSQKNNHVNVSVAVSQISIMVNIKNMRLTFIYRKAANGNL